MKLSEFILGRNWDHVAMLVKVARGAAGVFFQANFLVIFVYIPTFPCSVYIDIG